MWVLIFPRMDGENVSVRLRWETSSWYYLKLVIMWYNDLSMHCLLRLFYWFTMFRSRDEAFLCTCHEEHWSFISAFVSFSNYQNILWKCNTSLKRVDFLHYETKIIFHSMWREWVWKTYWFTSYGSCNSYVVAHRVSFHFRIRQSKFNLRPIYF